MKVSLENDGPFTICLLYTSDAADDSLRVDLGGRRIIKKKFFQAEDGIRDPLRLVGSEMCIRDSLDTVKMEKYNEIRYTKS